MNVVIVLLVIFLVVAMLLAARLASARDGLLQRVWELEASCASNQSAFRDLQRENEKLREAGAWFQGLFAATRNMVFVFRIQTDGMPGPFLEINEAACTRLKYRDENLRKMTLADIQCIETPGIELGYKPSELAVLSTDYIKQRQMNLATQPLRAFTQRVLDQGELTEEMEFRDCDGKRFPVVARAGKRTLGTTPVIILTAVEVSERKDIEKQLSECEQRLRYTFHTSPIGIAVYDRERKLKDVNPACLRIFGVPGIEEFRRFNMFDNPSIPGEIKAELAVGKDVRFEMPVAFDAAAGSDMISSRRDHAYFDVSICKYDLGKDATRYGYYVYVLDMTKRRRAERDLSQREKQLLQDERLHALGAVIGCMAHDFKNILTPIIGFTEIIKQKSGASSEIGTYATHIEEAADRANALVSDVLAYSRRESPDEASHEPIHVIPVIDEVLDQQHTRLPENIRIEKTIKTKQDLVMASADTLYQVLMNLCDNAVHAMQSQGGVLEVGLQDFHIKYVPRNKPPALPRGHYLRLSVRDTGTGIAPEILDHIFDPFFTTKPKGQGTGIGLAMVENMIKQLRGSVKVASEVGKGTVFHVVLPLV